MVKTQAFHGAGDARTPARIHRSGQSGRQVALASGQTRSQQRERRGGVVAGVMSESRIGVAGSRVFRQGRWKAPQV